MLRELDHAIFCPEAIFFFVSARYETCVASVAWRQQNEIGVLGKSGVAERFERNERVVLGGQDKCWQRYSFHYTKSAGLMVVVRRIAVSGMRSRDAVIELAERM